MAKKIELWQSDDGKTYDTEIKALRADVFYWKKQYDKTLDVKSSDKEDRSSYGSSGGGGHD